MKVTAPSVTRNLTSGWEDTEKKSRQTHGNVLYYTQIKLFHLYNTSCAIKSMKTKLQRRGFYKSFKQPSHSEWISHNSQTPELNKHWLYAGSKSQG